MYCMKSRDRGSQARKEEGAVGARRLGTKMPKALETLPSQKGMMSLQGSGNLQ